MRVVVLNEFVYFWSFSMTLFVVILSRLYGLGLGNVSAFVAYMTFLILYTKGAALRKISFGPVSRLALVYFLLAVGSLILQYHISGSLIDRDGSDTYEFAITNLIITFIYFLFGLIAVFSPRIYLRTKGVFLILIVLIFVILFGGGVFNYAEISSRIGSEVSQIEISQSFIVIVLFALAYSRRYQTIIMIMGSILLLLAGSRTAFFLGVATMLFYSTVVGSVSRRVTVILGFMLFLLFAFTFIDYGSNPLLSRMLLIGGIDGDSSAQSRLYQIELGLTGLRDQILLGDMNFVVLESGGIGYYIHNILGYWQQYGGIVFFVVCFLIFVIGKQLKEDYRLISLKDDPFIMFRLLMFVYTVVALLVSMSYTFKFFWFMVGLYSVDVNGKNRCLRPKIVVG